MRLPDNLKRKIRSLVAPVRRTLRGGLFVRPGHFYSPIVNVREADSWLQRQRAARARPPYAIRLNREGHLALWSRFLPWFAEMPFRAEPVPGLRYHFDNDAFGTGDGMLLYAMLRDLQPRRFIEVGSGYSSACSVDTLERYCPHPVALTFIEPYPKLLQQVLKPSDLTKVRILAHAVQETPLELFAELSAGDVLFIDSTHVLKTGSDVVFELFDVLPRLRPGVIIHFHDVFDAFEYPDHWILRDNRSWNELYALRAFLMYNESFEVVFFNDFFARTCAAEIGQTFPLFLKNPGGSLWLRKTR